MFFFGAFGAKVRTGTWKAKGKEIRHMKFEDNNDDIRINRAGIGSIDSKIRGK